MQLFETSALLDSECDNVESIFMTLAHKLYSKQPLRVVSVAVRLYRYTYKNLYLVQNRKKKT